MSRLEVLEVVLGHVAAQDVARAQDAARSTPGRFGQALSGFVAFLAGDHDGLDRASTVASGTTNGPEPVEDAIAAALPVLRAALGLVDVTDVALTELQDAALRATGSDRLSGFARYLAAEALMAAAQLDRAVAIAAGPAPSQAWAGHPYAGVMLACEARVATFTGDVSGALRMLARAASGDDLPGLLVKATHVLAAANAADLATTERLVAEVTTVGVDARDHLGRGVHLLLAFGVIATGEVDEAVAHLLRAGGGPDLELLTVVDRAICFEILVNAAVTVEDLEAARAWEARAQVWEHHRIAGPSVLRTRTRVALLAGNVDEAVDLAQQAVEAAAAENRAIEKAEGEILLARARIAAAQVATATRDLRAAVARSDATGHHAMRQAASRELRPARRRLPPPTGGGRDTLSARERDVADLILAGAHNKAIADALHLSPATVRAHAGRVLAAYGVATRIGLLAAVRELPEKAVRPDDLTARQADVAALVAVGRSNQQIAVELGVQEGTVEKYISQVLVRWDAGSRFAVAHRWWSLQTG